MEFYFLDVFRIARIISAWILINSCEGLIDFTCTSNAPRIAINGSDELNLTGYLSGSDTDATVTFGLQAFTGTGFALPGTTLPADASSGYAARHVLPPDAGTARVGVFKCQAEQNGVTNNVVITILSKYATFIPVSPTHTVSIGDSIDLEVTTNRDPLPKLEWRKDGVLLVDVNANQLILPITGAALSDAGIYQCYENKNQGNGQGAIIRLIVRACPEAKWGPPSCQNDCRVCYNGGVCDDQSGACVCGPGFSGASCQYVHGRNNFGQDGMRQCSTGADLHDNSCQGQLFCLPDPYGCSCAAGYQGIDCLQECPEGMFGAKCKQTCHCADGASVCLKDTGECETGGCQAGWTGMNCQVPDPCPEDYVGDSCEFKCNCPSTQTCAAQDDAAKCFNCNSAASSAPADVLLMPLSPTSVKLSWSAVQCSGTGMDLDLYGYKIVNQIDTEDIVTAETNGTEVIITGLKPCTEYAFSVAAKTSVSALYSSEQIITTETQVPGAVTSLNITPQANPSALHISWDSPASVCPATHYKVEYSLTNQDQCLAPYTSANLTVMDTSVTLDGLLPYSTYDIFVLSMNDAGPGSGMSIIYATPQTVPTSPPDSVSTTDITTTSLSFSWVEVPCGSRGGVGSGYSYKFVTVADESEVIRSTQDLSVTLSELMACNAYNFSVAGMTNEGIGPYSEALQAITGVEVPGEIEGITLPRDLNANYIPISWQPFASSCPATEYLIRVTSTSRIYQCENIDATLTLTTSNTSAILTNLLPYSYAELVITPGNSAGQAFPFTAIFPTGDAVPDIAPPNVRHTEVTATSLTFIWDEIPCRSRGGEIQRYMYRVTNTRDPTDVQSGQAGSTRKTINGLSPCTDYTFAVAGKTAKGIGQYSNELAAPTTNTTVPSEVNSLTISEPSNTTVHVSWQSPDSFCTATEYVVDYTLTSQDQCQTVDISTQQVITSDTAVVLSGLLPYSNYSVSVRGRNSAGDGASMTTEWQTAGFAPTAPPSNININSATSSSLTLTWGDVVCGGRGSAIKGYKYTLQNIANVVDFHMGAITNNVITITGLACYEEYEFRIAAVSDFGIGPWSDLYAVQTALAAPTDGVVNLSLSIQSTTELQVSWQPPASSCIATKYLVEYMLTNQDQCANVDSGRRAYGEMFETSISLAGLVPYSTYTVFVTAKNDAGNGPTVEAMGTTLETEPSAAPLGLTMTDGTLDSLTFSWGEVPCGNRGGEIQKYRYKLFNELNYNLIASGQTTNRTAIITGLMPCTSYRLSIGATNSAGDGPSVEFVTATAKSAPSMVQNLTITPQSSSDAIELSWQPPLGSCQPDIYRIEYLLTNLDQCQAMNGSRRTTSGVSTSTSYRVTRLSPHSTYIIFVTADSVEGDSPESTIIATTGQSAPRSAPVNILVSNSTVLQLNISWQSPPCGNRNGPITSYAYKLTTVSDKTEMTGNTPSTGLVLSNLTAGEEYMFVVAAVTSIGIGPYSTPVLQIVKDVPVETTTTTPTMTSMPTTSLTTSTPSLNVTTQSTNLTTAMSGNMTFPPLYTTSASSNMTSQGDNFTTSMTSPSGNFTTSAPYMTSPSGNFTTVAPNVTSPSGNFTTVAPNVTSPSGNFTTVAPNVTSPSGNFTTGAPNMTSPSGNFTTPTPGSNLTSAPSNVTSPSGNLTTSAPSNITSPSDNLTTTGTFTMTTLSGSDLTTSARSTMTSPAGSMTTFPDMALSTSSSPNVTFPGPTSTPSMRATTSPTSPAISKPGVPTAVSAVSTTPNSISIQWSPPTSFENQVISYEIRFWNSFEGEGSARNISLEGDFQNGYVFTYNITNLNASTIYSFKIRARNDAGVGPWSGTITKETKEYYEPFGLAVMNNTQTTLTVTWSPPASVNMNNIQAYRVAYRAITKPYDSSFIPGSLNSSPTLPDPMCIDCQTTIVGLEPSTQYEVQVTVDIDGLPTRPAKLEAFTKVFNAIATPGAPKLNADESTKTVIAIVLPPVESKYVSGLQIGVRKDQTRNKRAADSPVFGSSVDSPNSYIAGEVGRSDQGFYVGDNKTYEGHYNPPLTAGEAYDIYVAYVSRTSDDATIVWGEPLSVTAGQYGPITGTNTGGREPLAITWIIIICGVALLILFVLIIIIMVMSQHCHKKKETQSIMFENGTTRSLDAFPVDEDDIVGQHNQVDLSDEQHLACLFIPGDYRLIQPPRFDDPVPDSKPVTSIISLKPIDNANQMKGIDNPVMTTFSTPQHANGGTHANGRSTLPGIIDEGTPFVGTSIPVKDLPEYVKNKKADPRKGFHVEYKMLPDGKQHEWNDALLKENKAKNRYTNIVPYDHSRVRLHHQDGIPNSDYINACYINDYKQQKKYIASQGPKDGKDTTIAEFWQMIWEHKTNKIVMLTNCVESGKKKCGFYWPDLSKGVTQSFDTITVIPVSLEEYLDYTVRTFHMNKIGEDMVHTVKQFHFTAWPDMGVLQYPTPLLNFRRAVRAYNADSNALTVVHCSAGVGRTGAYISLDTLLDQAHEQGVVDVYKFVSDMREQRCKMVQTPEQYEFIYEAILEAVVCKNSSIPAASFEQEYTNMKNNPSPGSKIASLEEQYQLINYLTIKPDVGSCKAATKTENLDKNRFKDRLPSDRVRPFLVTPVQPPATDYINAALIPGFRKKNMYISTQMPLPSTVGDMWRLVHDYKATTVIMLNTMDNSDKTYGHYWPESGTCVYEGNLAVDFESSTKLTDSIMIRTFKMYINDSDKASSARIIQHYQFLDWYDCKGVPTDSHEALLSLVTMVDQWQKKSGGGPVIVQCVDGVGCSGVYCALSTILQRLEESQIVDVFQTVKALRMVRPNMVETMAQYKFLYEAIQHHISVAGPSAL